MASLIFQIFETPKVNERKIPKQRLCIVHKLTYVNKSYFEDRRCVFWSFLKWFLNAAEIQYE